MTEKTANIYLFANGNQAVFVDNEQVPALQGTRWVDLFLDWVKAQGYEVGKVTMPDGLRVWQPTEQDKHA